MLLLSFIGREESCKILPTRRESSVPQGESWESEQVEDLLRQGAGVGWGGRIMTPRDVRPVILRTCEYISLYDERALLV